MERKSMNYVEFKLTRESLHLTRQELSELWDINPRTVQRWDRGELPIALERQEQLKALDKAVEQAAENVVNLVLDEKEHHEGIECVNVLAYDKTTYDGTFEHYKLHNAVLMRAKHRLKRELKVNLKIIKFDYEKYNEWLNGRTDTMALRSAWAATQ